MAKPEEELNERLNKLALRDQQEISEQILKDAAIRPDSGGQIGRRITVLANMYKLRYAQDARLYIYDVDIKKAARTSDPNAERVYAAPERPIPTQTSMKIFRQAIRSFTDLTDRQKKSLAFDGRKFAVAPTSFSERSIEVNLDESQPEIESRAPDSRGDWFIVRLTRVNQVDSSVLSGFVGATHQDIASAGVAYVDQLVLALQAYNIAFRADCSGRYVPHGAGGRRFFDPQDVIDIPGGAQVWRGFFQSVLALKGGLYLNLDVCFSPFVANGPFLEVAARILQPAPGGGHRGGRGGGFGGGRGGRGYGGGRGGMHDGGHAERIMPIRQLSYHDQRELRKLLRDAPIKLTHRDSKAQKFNGFSEQSARTSTFERDGRTITVEQYFAEHLNIQLRHPDLPCAVIGQRRQLIPLELCVILAGKPIRPTAMSPLQARSVIQIAAQRPSDRVQETQRWHSRRAYDDRESRLREWQVDVEREMERVPARVLPAPMVNYRAGPVRDNLQAGEWNMRGNQFVRPGVTLKTPVIVNFTRARKDECTRFVSDLLRCMTQLGMRIELSTRPDDICYHEVAASDHDTITHGMVQAGRQAFAQTRVPPQIFLCIVEAKGRAPSVYNSIKCASTLAAPSATPNQCFAIQNILKAGPAYLGNVALKLNVKLGGVNHVVTSNHMGKLTQNDTMLIGMDVRHAAQGSSQPSVAAIVSTIDKDMSRFSSDVCLQTNPRDGQSQEVVLYGESMFRNLLLDWKGNNDGRLPTQVLIFRDGVSQGEYMAVNEREVHDFKEACRKLGGGDVKLTFIVSTKRHRVRFYPSDRRDADHKGNLLPGTVVDSGVVHPYVFDFYLQAHGGLIGTTRPAHYIVLRDDIGLSSDEIENICHAQSYAYCRSTRSVSQVAIVKYAHFLAEKASAMLLPDSISETASITSARSDRQINYRQHEGAYNLFKAKSLGLDEAGAMLPQHPAIPRFSVTLWFM